LGPAYVHPCFRTRCQGIAIWLMSADHPACDVRGRDSAMSAKHRSAAFARSRRTSAQGHAEEHAPVGRDDDDRPRLGGLLSLKVSMSGAAAAFALPTRWSTARANSPAVERASASCPRPSRSGATGARRATSRSPAALDRRFPVSNVHGPGRSRLAHGSSDKRSPALLPVHACQSSAFSGQVRGTPGGLLSAVRTHAGAESGFPLRATDGECPVQRLKAWLKDVDPSWRARQIARLDSVYPRLGGQAPEPSAHGPSEIPSAIARGQVDEQIGRGDVGPEPPRQPRPPHL
jgi:hypothetical protein